jgi:hypothetical protein
MATRAAGAPLLLEPGERFAVLITGGDTNGDGMADVHLDLALASGPRAVGEPVPTQLPPSAGRALVELGLRAMGAPDGLRERLLVAVDAFHRQSVVP